MKKGLLFILALTLMGLAPAGPAQADPILLDLPNSGFEAGNFSDWSKTGNVGLVKTYQQGVYSAQITYGTLSRSFATTPGASYVVSFLIEDIQTGNNIVLPYDKVSARWGDAPDSLTNNIMFHYPHAEDRIVTIESIRYTYPRSWVPITSEAFVATSENTTLLFDFYQYSQKQTMYMPAGYFLFDNATIAQTSFPVPETPESPASNPVPEPATMLLVGAGLLGIGAFRKGFKRN